MAILFHPDINRLPKHVFREVREEITGLSETEGGRDLLSRCRAISPADERRIRREIRLIELLASQFHPFQALSDVNVVAIDLDATRAKGFCISERTIALVCNKYIQQHYNVIAHELYHLVRKRVHRTPRLLGEHLVEEGLANCFAFRDIFPESLPPFYRYTPDVLGYFEEQIMPHLRKVRGMIHSTDYNHREFFFGGGPYPTDFGYQLGMVVVDAWLMHNNKRTADVIHIPAKEIYQPWLDGVIPIIGTKRLTTNRTQTISIPKAEP